MKGDNTMKVNNFIQVFDMNDNSEKQLYLKGVLVGNYRNDIFSKWYATQEIQIADFEKYICKRLESVVGYSIMNGKDILRADKDCRQKKGMGIADWVQNWMKKETREELLAHG